MDTDVLIVGAGPTGLALTARLHRLGVAVRIIDKHAGVLELTKSAALHARTLEHLRDLGLADAVLAEGRRVDVLCLRTGHRDRIAVDFRTLADTAYPFMVDLPQARTEHLLIDLLAERGVRVERGTECTGFVQDADGVSATVVTDGRASTVRARWLVGCDGARSTVRELLGIERAGAPYADDWVLCDADVDWPLPRNEMTFSGDTEGIFGVFPLPGERRYRLAYTATPGVEPDLRDAQNAMARTGVEGTIRSVDQFWTFSLAHEQAVRYRDRRVLLAGDAGHVHTPFGGQGLNLGVGDAMNLAWRLAAAAHGDADALDAYEDERHPVAAQVIAFTHRGARMMLLRGDPRRHVRDAALTVLRSSPRARRALARRFSQLDHGYRRAPGNDGRVRGLAGGDRLPDLAFFDGRANRSRRLHDLLPSDRHTVLLTDAAHAEGLSVPESCAVRVITPDWARAASTGAVPTALDRGREAARLYGAAYLVRPDRHIAYAGPPAGLPKALAPLARLREVR